MLAAVKGRVEGALQAKQTLEAFIAEKPLADSTRSGATAS